ncbi:MFS transporter [Bacillus salipaludis]|uniref:MFS transporter n=1 Tax=Bacillus salipaludis TaxID=2547811 RepID=A0AA90TRV1_9BACI|nr:MFS transporter [Bacillus salipaludis]MDQ6596595.1 MFS transporter [Bacillus salipaludis]
MNNFNAQTIMPTKKMTKIRWFYIAFPLLLLFTVSMMDKANINILLANKPFLQDLGIDGNLVKGTLSSIFLVTYAFGQLAWGFIIDKIGAQRSGLIGISLWAFAMVLGGIADSISMILWSRALLGIGEGVLYPMALKLTSNWFPYNEQAKAQTTWYSGNAFGPVLGLPLIAIIASAYGWRESYFILAAISIVCLILFWIMARDNPAKHYAVNQTEFNYIQSNQKVEVTITGNKGSIKTVLISPLFWILTIVYSCFSIGYYGISTFLPSYLTEEKGIDFVNSAVINAGGFALAIVVQMVTGYFSDRFMKRAVFVGGAGALIIVFMLLSLFTTNSTVAAILSILLIGLLFMPAALTMTMLHRVASPEVMGSISGIFGCLSYLIAALGPMIVGIFSQMSGSYNGGFIAILCFIALSLFLSVFLVRKGF